MTKITHIQKKYTPLVLSQMVPWDKIEKCIVIYEDEEGDAVFHCSDMKAKDRVWLQQVFFDASVMEVVRKMEEE